MMGSKNKKRKPIKLLFDGDMLVYEACASCTQEVNWEGDVWSLFCNASDAEAQVEDRISCIVDSLLDLLNFEGKYEIIICFSDPDHNFRKDILSTYKLNRANKMKPLAYRAVIKWVKERYTTVQLPTLEADDCVGILATANAGNEVHISGDKDFKSIPGVFYDFIHGTLHTLTEYDADKWFYTQVLTGDTADNYKGCPGCGAKSAEKLLTSEGVTWKTVLKAYQRQGLSEKDALQQARVARILRDTDYDMKKKKVKLWIPTKNF